MHKLFIPVISLLLSSSIINAQWFNQNPVPDGNHLYSTFFIDSNTGWIIGSDGFIKKTTNAGLDWVQQNGGSNNTLRSIQFVDQNTGWICGDNGLVIKTTDGGNNWFSQSSGTTELLSDLHFVNTNTGFAVGFNETILKTADGGLNWYIKNSGTDYDLYSVDFVSPLIGFAAGGRNQSKFLKTTDGGLNWTVETSILGGMEKRINSVEFIDANTGWIGSGWGSGGASLSMISKTTDGGNNWSTFIPYRPASYEDSVLYSHVTESVIDNIVGIRSICFKDANNGYAVSGTASGWRRGILTTTDGGVSWQSKYFNDEQTGLLSVYVDNSGVGLAVGYYGVIYSLESSNSSWSQILSGTQSSWTGDWIQSVFMTNDSIGWAAGSRKGSQKYPLILKTTNGGKIWKTNFELSNNWYSSFSDIFFVNENIGWASGGDVGAFSYKTTDGGQNWFNSGYGFDQIYFIDQNIGWGVNLFSGVYKTTCGGTEWFQKSNISSSSIFFSDALNGWAAGANGSILKSTDGGENWTAKLSGISSDLNSVHFFNSNIGMAVGNSGTALLTTDGGENWTSQSTGYTAHFNSVLFTNSSTVWIAGSDGVILNSTDMGNSWISFSSITDVNIVSASFTSEASGWFAGLNGTIFKYENDVIPVELVSFSASLISDKVHLNWQTATELNNFGFEIERKTDNSEWIIIGFVNGHGNSTSPKSYSFIDNTLFDGSKFTYRLKQTDIDGSFEYSNEIEVELVPAGYALHQNYPNPFNPTTNIRYELLNESNVTIKVYDILGSEIMTLVNESKKPGIYEVEFNAENLSSGTYIYRISAGDAGTSAEQSFVETRKMTLIK
ncbi:MAG: T9SS type A sorting domain-containing protein [Ignavibacterium sp.]|nr:T9SS type A sorting domain-containing protein [Ignavibacterium sp.]